MVVDSSQMVPSDRELAMAPGGDRPRGIDPNRYSGPATARRSPSMDPQRMAQWINTAKAEEDLDLNDVIKMLQAIEGNDYDVTPVIERMRHTPELKQYAYHADIIMAFENRSARQRLIGAGQAVLDVPAASIDSGVAIERAWSNFGRIHKDVSEVEKKDSPEEKDKKRIDRDRDLVALDTAELRYELLLAKQAQGPKGPSAMDNRQQQLAIARAEQELLKAQKTWKEWNAPQAEATRRIVGQVGFLRAGEELRSTEQGILLDKTTREWLGSNMQTFLETAEQIDPDNPESWTNFDEAQVALYKGILDQQGKSATSVEDWAKLLAPVQGIVTRMERRRQEAERDKKQQEKEEETRLEEEAIGRSGMAMQSAFSAEATSGLVAPEAIDTTPGAMAAMPPASAAPAAVTPGAPEAELAAPPIAGSPPAAPGSSPVDALLGDVIIEEEQPVAGGGNPPIGIQEVLDKYNGTGGGDPYHESEELDLDGSDNNGEEVIIEEISFMPPHPIRKFAPPVARGAPPVIINIGTGGFTPPII